MKGSIELRIYGLCEPPFDSSNKLPPHFTDGKTAFKAQAFPKNDNNIQAVF